MLALAASSGLILQGPTYMLIVSCWLHSDHLLSMLLLLLSAAGTHSINPLTIQQG